MIRQIFECCIDCIRETGKFSAEDGTPYYTAAGNPRSKEVIVVSELSVPGVNGLICTIDFDENGIRIFRNRDTLVTQISYAEPDLFDLMLQAINSVSNTIPRTG